MQDGWDGFPSSPLFYSSSPSQLPPSLPALFYLPGRFSSLGFARALFRFAANSVGLVLIQSGSQGETRWTSTRKVVGGSPGLISTSRCRAGALPIPQW